MADLEGRTVLVVGSGRMGAALAHSVAAAGAKLVVASHDPDRATRLARLYAGRGIGLQEAAQVAPKAAGVAVALGGPWSELGATACVDLPPLADISAPRAVPDSVLRHLNGRFLGIDDLYQRPEPLPGAYIKDAERLVAIRAAEFVAWLERSR